MNRCEKGSALILALIISAVLMIFGLTLAVASLDDFTMAEEFESHQQALMIAEAGLAAAELQLRQLSLDEALSATSQVLTYGFPGPSSHRDPVNLAEARSIDYNRLPSPTGSVTLNGMLTPGTGTPYGTGRYIARISDNDDGDGDLTLDSDFEVYIRAVGIQPGPPQQVVRYGSNFKNSVVMVEMMVQRDMTFKGLVAPFVVSGPSAVPFGDQFFEGNSFLVDGHDHSDTSVAELITGNHSHGGEPAEQAAISVLNDDPMAGDGYQTGSQIYDGVGHQQHDNLEGAQGDYGSGTSIRDDTELLRNSDNPDVVNLFNAQFLSSYLGKAAAVADTVYPAGTELSGSNIVLGTDNAPQITVVEGDLSISGGGTGSGLLIVKGTLLYSGAFNFNGLIMVVGEGRLDIGGANKSLIGGLYVARIEEDEDGNPYFGTPTFSIRGQTNFYYRSASMGMAINLLPVRRLGWREITGGI